MTAFAANKKLIRSRGVTLMEMGLILLILSAITLAVILSLSNYSKNQAISNDAKLDQQSLEEVMRAANNYFAVCTQDNSVTIDYLIKNYFLATRASLKEISWVDPITASMTGGIAKSFSLRARFTGKNENQGRYSYLLQADKVQGNTFTWQRNIGVFKSYDINDVNLGPKMGNYIELMNRAASQSHTPGAKSCQN
jgi:competence protein ComGC